jgi:hypothetical protein
MYSILPFTESSDIIVRGNPLIGNDVTALARNERFNVIITFARLLETRISLSPTSNAAYFIILSMTLGVKKTWLLSKSLLLLYYACQSPLLPVVHSGQFHQSQNMVENQCFVV